MRGRFSECSCAGGADAGALASPRTFLVSPSHGGMGAGEPVSRQDRVLRTAKPTDGAGPEKPKALAARRIRSVVILGSVRSGLADCRIFGISLVRSSRRSGAIVRLKIRRLIWHSDGRFFGLVLREIYGVQTGRLFDRFTGRSWGRLAGLLRMFCWGPSHALRDS